MSKLFIYIEIHRGFKYYESIYYLNEWYKTGVDECTTLQVNRGKVDTTNKGENFICLNYGLDAFYKEICIVLIQSSW